ncbi:MAG: biotin--[acetyl-CoA-carboxylase] ligase [Actinobacteria bacterium]|nr:biotin--[acetyl-CoA-carboxylase] ligase [Actinomycetota bacterium]
MMLFSAMLADSSASDLKGTRFRLVELAETGSTNADLVGLARAGERTFLAVRTGFQSAGRGRRDRSWDAPPGSGLMMSVLFPAGQQDEVASHAQQMASCLGFAALRACVTSGADVALKWPNDIVGPVLSDGTLPKLAGVLGETVTRGTKVLGVVVGVGLNLRPVPERAAALGRSVVALDEITDQRVSPTEMAKATLRELELILTRLAQADGAEWLRGELFGVSAVIGRDIEVVTDGESIGGLAIDIDADGRLVVETAAGRHTISVGDVVSARVRN